MEKGVRMGRPARITDAQRHEIARRRQEGEPLKILADAFGISPGTVSRIATGTDSHQSRKKILSPT